MRKIPAYVCTMFFLSMIVYVYINKGLLKVRERVQNAAQNTTTQISSRKTYGISGVQTNETQIPLDFLRFNSTDKEQIEKLISAKCVDDYIVPPVLHYVWLSKKKMLFHEYVGMFSAHKFIKPCYIMIHGDTIPSGKWWDLLLSQVKNIIFVRREAPENIFGIPIKTIEYKADFMRLEILLEYGGIYSDTDLYFLRSFDPLRNHTMTLSREGYRSIANGIMLCDKNAPMLKIFYESYHTFSEDKEWCESSTRMLHKLYNLYPELVNLQPGMVMLGDYYTSTCRGNEAWNHELQYSVHLYSRFCDNRYTLDIEQVKKLNTTIGALTRFVLFDQTDLIRN